MVGPDERTLRGHLQLDRFKVGVADGRWRLVEIAWPYVRIAVSAAPQPASPEEFVIRLDMSGYPEVAPTGGVWDMEGDCTLAEDKRPKGERAALIFRYSGFGGAPTAMYAPWDREGLKAHPEWAQKHPQSAWNPERDITFILANVHEILNADDYEGV
jgi:hypothetical protein